jgi:hypothetical protein
MSTGALIGIIIIVIIVAAAGALTSAQLRRARMRRRFGPEYDRLAKEIGPRKADAELTARQRRVEAMDIHPLSAQQQASYSGDWAAIQERFVDAPAEAVAAADMLIWGVMRDRGYPANDINASMEALSVYHARSLDGYRQTRDLRTESATTEELREAMLRRRALFEDLTGLREGQRRREPDRAAGISHRAAEDSAAGNDRVVAGNGGRTAENSDRGADDDLSAEDTDRTADTPR